MILHRGPEVEGEVPWTPPPERSRFENQIPRCWFSRKIREWEPPRLSLTWSHKQVRGLLSLHDQAERSRRSGPARRGRRRRCATITGCSVEAQGVPTAVDRHIHYVECAIHRCIRVCGASECGYARAAAWSALAAVDRGNSGVGAPRALPDVAVRHIRADSGPWERTPPGRLGGDVKRCR